MVRWRIAILISVAIAISYLDRSAFPAAYTAIKADFHFDNTDKAYLDSAFLLAYGLMYLGGGKLLDALGTRKGFAIVILFWSLACMSHGFATGFWTLLAARLALGVGEGGGFPAATRSVAEWFTVKERSTAMGIMNFGSALGSIVASPLILIIILPSVFWFGITSWRWGFLITGACGLVWLIWWLRDYHLPEDHPRISAGEREMILSSSHAYVPGQAKVPIRRLLSFPQTWGLMFARFLTDAGWYFMNFWLPTYLMTARHLDFRGTGSINWIPPAAAGVGCLASGYFSSWLLHRGCSVDKARKMAMGIAALCLPLVMIVPFVSVPWVMAIFSLAFFGHQSWSTLVMVLPTDIYPKRAVGTVAGLVGMAGAIGGITLGQTAGYLLDHGFSYVPIMIIAGSLHVTGFLTIVVMIPRLTPLPIDEPGGFEVIPVEKVAR